MNIRTILIAVVASSLAIAWLTTPNFAGLPDTAAHAAPAAQIQDAPGGEVYDVAVGPDGTTNAVGSFTDVGAATGGLARLDAGTALVDRAFPAVNGVVRVMVADPAGGYFIGGSFTAVGGYARGGLARLTASGESPRV